MESEICVFPEICTAMRSSSGTTISSNNFNLEIDIHANYSYTCGDKFVEECHFSTKRVYKYKSLSWDIVDTQLLASDFPYPLEKVKWDGAGKILKSKDDLIQKILEFAHTLQNITRPFQDNDTVHASLVFVKHVHVSHQEFELIRKRNYAKYYKSIAEILWGKVRDKINGSRRESSLYEEFQCLEGYVEKIVRESIQWRMYLNETCERVLIGYLTEQASKEFRSLSAVRSRMQFLQRVDLPQNESADECSICMGSCLQEQDTYNMPCNHSFHYGCIETWLLKNPTCPMCRYKLPSTEST